MGHVWTRECFKSHIVGYAPELDNKATVRDALEKNTEDFAAKMGMYRDGWLRTWCVTGGREITPYQSE